MFSDRLQVQIVIGSDTVTQNELDAVKANLAARYGGLTVVACEGLWAADGAEFIERYGQIVTEAAYMILLTTVPAALDMEYIQRACLPLVGFAEWIHVELHTTKAMHFNLTTVANGAIIAA